MNPSRFRKKPVEIEAVQFGGKYSYEEIREWCPALRRQDVGGVWDYFIRTLEGHMQVSIGDWIIKGVAGEFYPCKPDIFEETYESA